MRIKPIIDRLKTNALSLGGRVSGASEFSAEVEAMRLPLPCAFVLRASGEAQSATSLGAVLQMVNQDFAIVIAVDNSKDTRGQDGAESLDAILEDVQLALLGWTPPVEEHNAFEFVRDDHISIDRSRLWHQTIYRTIGPIMGGPYAD